jgi:hypothetical protein
MPGGHVLVRRSAERDGVLTYADGMLTYADVCQVDMYSVRRSAERDGVLTYADRMLTYADVCQVDMYSYGVVLSEMVTGEKPYAGLNQMQIAFATVYQGQRPNLPGACADVC